MTIKLNKTPDTLADRILRYAGKERAYIVPSGSEETMGPHVYACAVKESFWSALLRPKGAPLPEGSMSSQAVDDLLDGKE